jgi:hypothetical protein
MDGMLHFAVSSRQLLPGYTTLSECQKSTELPFHPFLLVPEAPLLTLTHLTGLLIAPQSLYLMEALLPCLDLLPSTALCGDAEKALIKHRKKHPGSPVSQGTL